MNISNTGLNLIKHFEGLHLRAYPCAASVWTIGYGHTLKVTPGDEITIEEANRLLLQDIADAECSVNHVVRISLTQHQFDALVSFVFNTGSGNFRTSTLLRKLNAGNYSGAAEEFLRWVNAGGKHLPGLVRRREAEKQLFLKPDI